MKVLVTFRTFQKLVVVHTDRTARKDDEARGTRYSATVSASTTWRVIFVGLVLSTACSRASETVPSASLGVDSKSLDAAKVVEGDASIGVVPRESAVTAAP